MISIEIESNQNLKCYTPRFCVEGLLKSFDFGYFVLILSQTDKKQEMLEQRCKDLFIWTELPVMEH